MSLSTNVVALADRILTREIEFTDEEDVFALNRDDVIKALERSRDPRGLMRQTVTGQNEFGATELFEMFKSFTLVWATYKAAKEILQEGSAWRALLVNKDERLEEEWSARLREAGLPKHSQARSPRPTAKTSESSLRHR